MTARLSKSIRIEFTYDVNSSKNMAYLVSTESSEKTLPRFLLNEAQNFPRRHEDPLNICKVIRPQSLIKNILFPRHF